MAKAQNYMGGGTLHINLDGGTIEVGTLHNIERQDKANYGKGTELNWRGDTAQKSPVLGGGDTVHTFLMGPRLKEEFRNPYGQVDGWMGGWVVGWFLSGNIILTYLP